MAHERKKVGLIFSYDERWIAGAYYIFNLVHAIKSLPDDQQPELVVFTNSYEEYQKLIKETCYPFTQWWLMRRMDLFSRLKRSLNYRLGREIFKERPSAKDVQAIFPLTYTPLKYFANIPRKIFWIPDFQESYYPDFFSPQEIERRKRYQEMLAKCNDQIVFSSKTAKSHYEKLFPGNTSRNFVVPFAVTHTLVNHDINAVKEKYGIDGEFFLCSNQFWAHKNHKLVIDAVAIARKTNPSLRVVFTGKGDDRRNPQFYPSLLEVVRNYAIESNVYFLGLIPREDQLCLLTNCIAVIQPSMFEGWSTIIEDAKAMCQHVIASDIDVHREQLADYPYSQLVSRSNPAELAAVLTKQNSITSTQINFDYDYKVQEFGRLFMKLLDT